MIPQTHPVCVDFSVCVCADRVLKAKQHQLDLVDGVGVEVEVQFELGDGGGHDAPLRRMNEVPQDADDLLDVFNRELELLTALFTHKHIYIDECVKIKTLHNLNWKHYFLLFKPFDYVCDWTCV